MIACVVAMIATCLTGQLSVEEVHVARLDELAVLWVDPTGGEIGTEPRRRLARVLERRTALAAVELDPRLGRACEGEMSCIVLGIRPVQAGACLPVDAPASLPRIPDARDGPRYLLLISHTSPHDGESGVLETMLVDIDRALGFWCAADPSVDAWKERARAQILAGAVIVQPTTIALVAPDDVERGFAQVLDASRPTLERTHDWGGRGAVVVRADASGFVLRLDGRAIGEARRAAMKLIDLAAGEHHLSISRAGRRTAELDIALEAGAELEVPLELEPEEPGHSLRVALGWGGAGVAVSGAVLTAYAIALGAQHNAIACVGTEPSCGSRELIAFGYSAGSGSHFEDPNAGGVKIAPLGLALLVGGGTATLTTLLFGEEGDVPWLQLAGGVAIGALTYGVSAALGGQSAFKE